MNKLTRPLAIVITLVVTACGTRGPLWEQDEVVLGPIQAASNLVWMNRTTATLIVLDPTGAHTPRGIDISRLPRTMTATPTGILIAGGRGDAPTLDVINLPEGKRETLHPVGAYDRMDVSSDGHYAVLYYDPSQAPAPGGPAARNNNEITVVDLTIRKPVHVSLGTESVAPLGVVFSPAEPIVAIVMTAAVVFVRLDAPTVQVQVPLKLADGTALSPAQEIFSADGRYLYVRTSGSDDVLALDVISEGGKLNSAVNFLFFPGASGLAEIAVPPGDGFIHSVAALYSNSATSTAVLLDASGDTSRTHFLQLAQSAKHLSVLDGGMLLLSAQSGSSVTGWEPLVDRSQKDVLPAASAGRPLVVGGSAFFSHSAVSTSGGASAALTRVSLSDDGSLLRVNQSPIVLGGTPVDMTVDPIGGTVVISVSIPRADSGAGPVLGTDSDYSGNTASIVTIDPKELAIGGLVLDAETNGIGVANGQVYAFHPSALGDVTFFPLNNPVRSAARRVVGYLASHLLDQGAH